MLQKFYFCSIWFTGVYMNQIAIAVGEMAPYFAVFFFVLFLFIKSLKISKRASRQGDTKTLVIIFGIYVIIIFNMNVVCWVALNSALILKFDFYHFLPLEDNPIKGIFQR